MLLPMSPLTYMRSNLLLLYYIIKYIGMGGGDA
jgi:hypothetical protein